MSAPLRLLGLVILVSSPLLSGCPKAPEGDCGEFDEVYVWSDLDGDGFGVDPIGWVCAAGEGQATNSVDCDDADPAVHPSGEEICDLLDNDCNGSIDETVAKTAWYPDADADGFGSNEPPDFACKQPTDLHLGSAGDCDDSNANVNPLALEICNAIDDDCDTFVDDSDGGVDPESQTSWYQDVDLDGYGDSAASTLRCAAPPGGIADGTDCNDANPGISPGIIEICNRIDDDCDLLTDDLDPSIDPTTQDEYFADVDEDGYGDPAQLTLSCEASNGASDNDLDCDDNDPLVTIPTDWYLDLDGDTYGSGAVLAYGCFPPAAGTAPGVFGLDCDETSVDINPGATEICDDGIDNDCSGADQSCGPIGFVDVEDGPSWTLDPPVYSCLDACAFVHGGVATDYHCSTSPTVVNNMAYVTGWGDAAYCSGAGRPEDFKLEPAGNPGYDCGSFGCAYSAYTLDNCGASRNWCWLR